MDLVRLSGGLLVKQKTKEERDKIKKKKKMRGPCCPSAGIYKNKNQLSD
jgi:hypothetical protein